MNHEVREWLIELQEQSKENKRLYDEIKFQIQLDSDDKDELEKELSNQQTPQISLEKKEFNHSIPLTTKILEVEKTVLMRLWHEKRINHEIKNKLLQNLDYRARQLAD